MNAVRKATHTMSLLRTKARAGSKDTRQATAHRSRPCTKCRNHSHCTQACVYVDEILSREKAPAEPFLRHDDVRETRDYKEVLSEMRKKKEERLRVTIAHIRSIQDVRIRAIATMIYARIPVCDISKLLGKSESQIYRLIQAGAGGEGA